MFLPSLSSRGQSDTSLVSERRGRRSQFVVTELSSLEEEPSKPGQILLP